MPRVAVPALALGLLIRHHDGAMRATGLRQPCGFEHGGIDAVEVDHRLRPVLAHKLEVERHQTSSRRKLTSTARAECVIAPDEMKSAPDSAYTRTLSSVMPPESSTLARPLIARMCAADFSGLKLSSSKCVAPAASASSISSRVRTSTSIGKPALRAFSMAFRTPPAAARWLFLIKIASYKPMRWFVTPPAAVAIFSRRRSPGVVLRVSRIWQPVPSTALA